MHKGNWDDLRFVLAVAENGSVAAAARSLGVNHATVLRRIAAFEERHGGEVFLRTPQGYAVPQDRQRLFEAAREVEAAILAVERVIEGGHAPLTGTVRVTSTDTLCSTLLPPALAEVGRDATGLKLELICSNAHLDLARLQSDIAVRPAAALPDDLTGIPAADLGFAPYAAPGAPDRWLVPGGALSRSVPAKWLAERHMPGGIAGSSDSFVTLREMAAAGMGRTILPAILGDADPRLDRLEGVMPAMSVPLWVASHADLAAAPRIAVVRDRLAEALATRAKLLLGEL
ncbi:LysR family transcriptional regulator [Pseudoruegeria sp. HB172150]|uniref:LysR family transcriptional regulator n=1 Tax=Pseudoruegeria sp. HB172150 TaxID=2721164 RepID=UPI00155190D3|nr:LysR family transcriptional regulator [Pseudoruegeria sp. HB172150]